MKEIGKICVYLLAVLVCGAMLSPFLYWGVQALIHAGYATFLQKHAFQKYVNRSVLISAFALLWPAVRWIGVRGRADLAVLPDPRRWENLLRGVAVGAGVMLLLAAGYLAAGVYQWEGNLGAKAVVSVLVSAVVVSLLEETLFRGAITGLLRRSMSPGAAMMGTSVLFAAVHFLKPDPSVRVTEVGLWSGFELVPHMFHQFANPLLLLGGFCTLLVLGLVLGLAALRSGALWMSIGVHAGLVLVKGLFSKGAEQRFDSLPWVGRELQIGVCPVVGLLLALGCVWWLTRPAAISKENS